MIAFISNMFVGSENEKKQNHLLSHLSFATFYFHYIFTIPFTKIELLWKFFTHRQVIASRVWKIQWNWIINKNVIVKIEDNLKLKVIFVKPFSTQEDFDQHDSAPEVAYRVLHRSRFFAFCFALTLRRVL